MSHRWLPLASCLLCATALAEPPQAACNAFPADAWASPAALRETARDCDSPALARLFYNRAYHLELLQRFGATLRLETYHRQDDARHYHAYRMLIGLGEALLGARHDSAPERRADWLNDLYDRAGEIAELRLRGYDNVAERRDRRIWSQAPATVPPND